jgi:DNA-binding MarR family transcriptional regulator
MRTLLFDLYDRRAQVAEALDLSFVRAKALLRLLPGPLTMRELAGKLAIDAPYTTVVVDDLERRGLVARTPHAEDRRAKLVTLTATGRQAAEVADAIQNEPPDVLTRLDAGELAELDRILSRLVAAAEQQDDSAV